MDDFVATCRQELRDQAPVAAPPRRLRAHETGSRLGESLLECRLPRFGAHPSRIASKRGHTNAGEALLAWFVRSPPAKLLRMTVGDSGRGQKLRQRRLIELGIAPRAGEAAHVDQGFGRGLSQTGDELFGGTGAMTDGEDIHARRIAGFLGVDAWRGRELERQPVYGAKDWFPF
jgi:hypothetical protein